MQITLLTIAAIALAYIFTFVNGMHDGSNVIATIIVSRSLSPKKALIFTCIAEIIGPLLIGTAVATTIGKEVIKYDYINNPGSILSITVILAALIGGMVWNLTTWKIGIPSSSSHGLIGGLLGAGLAAYGFNAINWQSFFWKIILSMFASPLIGFIVGYIFMVISKNLLKNSRPAVNNIIKKTQVLSMIFLGINHGSSDGQKSAGVITLLLVIGQISGEFIVPKWVLLSSSVALMLGIVFGGWNIIKTVGAGIYKVKPVHSLNTQLSAATVILVSNLLGAPVSTTQIVSSSIMGIGSAERINAVKWLKVRSIFLSWFITIPMSAVVSAICFYIVNKIISL